MNSVALRVQIESALSKRIPSALTPMPKLNHPLAVTGIGSVDELLQGGLPIGAMTEISGPECSGRTSLALSFVARMTETSGVCAWVDVCDTLSPESAAAAGVDLSRLLWVRCGVTRSFEGPAQQQASISPFTQAAQQHDVSGGYGPHPRSEARGLATAVGGFLRAPAVLRSEMILPRIKSGTDVKWPARKSSESALPARSTPCPTPWLQIEDALRVTDLLLQSGGFGAIVLDMGSIAPEYALRVPLATWFRYRAGAERTQASILLLTQQPCAKSRAGLVLRLQHGNEQNDGPVFSGMGCQIELVRQRFAPADSNVVSIRKPPQRETTAHWKSHAACTGTR